MGSCFGQAQKYEEFRLINGIPPPLDKWIANVNTDTCTNK